VVAGSVLASAVLLVVVSASLRRAVVKPVAVAVAVAVET